jgi:glutamine synthetase
MSLWDPANQTNLFEDEQGSLSQLGYWFMGGVLKHAKALAAVANPLVNSYKRLITGAPLSGATWAPVYITYGGSNRTQMVRLPGGGRFECRTVDGAANPYLTIAAMLAAGLDGIEHKIDPGKRNDDNLYEIPEDELKRRGIDVLPRSLAQAIDHLEADEVVQSALGEVYASYYIQVKRDEWRRYHNSVSQWEVDNYLGVY